MKRFFLALIKGMLYVLLFFGLQLLVSVLYTIACALFSAYSGAWYGLDMAAIQTMLTEQLLGSANLVTLIADSATLALIVLIIRAGGRRVKEHLQLIPMSIGGLWPCIALGVALSFVVTAAFEVLPIPESWMQQYEVAAEALEGGNAVVALLATVVVAPLAEEVVFRGMVYSRFRAGMSVLVALLLECALFAVMHGALLWIIYAFALAVVMTLLVETCGSLYASIAFHMAFNLFGSYVTPYMSYSSPLTPLLAGLALGGVCVWVIAKYGRKRLLLKGKK